jgi:hypothetical protein
MRNRLFALGVVAVAALLVTSAFAANRGVEFTPIGFIDDPGPWPASAIYSMNPSGTVFMASPSPFGNYCVQWTKDGGWGTEVGNAGGVCYLAEDGTIAADGYEPYGYDYPGYWLGEVDQWDPIPLPDNADSCGGSPLSMHGASDNLEYLVGLGWEGCNGRRFIYERSTDTTVQLGCMDEESCRINDVSNDGDKTVGWNTALCGAWRGAAMVDGTYDWVDGLGTLQRKYCTSGGPCCGNYDCPEFVDAYCTNLCENGACVGGPDPGAPCNGNWECQGYCVNGPNDGDVCTSSYYCPDDDVCLDNPDWDEMAMEHYKGEAYKVTPDGKYTLGFEYGQSPYDWSDPNYDWTLYASAYVGEPDGSFTKIPPPPGAFEGDSWTPLAISDDGNVVVGRFGWWIYSYPTVWIRGVGTLDLQYFLVAQGLDELWFWTLSSANAVSADGTIIAGYGSNPDWLQEGWVLDISKMKVCHAPPGNPENARTLSIGIESVADHMAHGDFLGTCEFKNSGGLSRAADLRSERPTSSGVPADFDPMLSTEEGFKHLNHKLGAESAAEDPGRNLHLRKRTRATRSAPPPPAPPRPFPPPTRTMHGFSRTRIHAWSEPKARSHTGIQGGPPWAR